MKLSFLDVVTHRHFFSEKPKIFSGLASDDTFLKNHSYEPCLSGRDALLHAVMNFLVTGKVTFVFIAETDFLAAQDVWRLIQNRRFSILAFVMSESEAVLIPQARRCQVNQLVQEIRNWQGCKNQPQALLCLENDFLQKYWKEAELELIPPPVFETRLNRASWFTFTRILNESDRVLIYLGEGWRGSQENIKALAEKLDALVLCSPDAYQSFDFDHPRFVGFGGAQELSRKKIKFIEDCDGILNLGGKFNFAKEIRFVKNFRQVLVSGIYGERRDSFVAENFWYIPQSPEDAVRGLLTTQELLKKNVDTLRLQALAKIKNNELGEKNSRIFQPALEFFPNAFWITGRQKAFHDFWNLPGEILNRCPWFSDWETPLAASLCSLGSAAEKMIPGAEVVVCLDDQEMPSAIQHWHIHADEKPRLYLFHGNLEKWGAVKLKSLGLRVESVRSRAALGEKLKDYKVALQQKRAQSLFVDLGPNM